MSEKELIKKDNSHHLRCVKCKKVLAKEFSDGHFEIKCPRCNTINLISEKSQEGDK